MSSAQFQWVWKQTCSLTCFVFTFYYWRFPSNTELRFCTSMFFMKGALRKLVIIKPRFLLILLGEIGVIVVSCLTKSSTFSVTNDF